MKVQITIETGNAAFQDYGEGIQTGAILEKLGSHLGRNFPLELVPTEFGLYDANGNRVGTFEVVQD